MPTPSATTGFRLFGSPPFRSLPAMRGIFCSLLLAEALVGCRSASSPDDGSAAHAQTLRFRLCTGAETGLRFSNQLRPTAAFIVFNYMYFFNGAGAATADFNADGLTYIFLLPTSSPVSYTSTVVSCASKT